MMNPRFSNRSATINVMTAAIQKASRALVRDFGEVEHLQVSKKGLGDFVSSADHRSEKTLIQELRKARPDYGFIAEESGIIPGADPEHCWIIDPLDGTTNFLHGIPHFAIVVALKKGNEIIASTTYDPIRDELFWSEKGKGSFVNQQRIRVSGRTALDEALVATGIPFGNHGDKPRFLACADRLMPLVSGIRRFGAAALDLAYVAMGRCDAYFEDDIKIWDVAAGILLVKEAGGYVTETNGGSNMLNSGSVLAANTYFHEPILKVLSAK